MCFFHWQGLGTPRRTLLLSQQGQADDEGGEMSAARERGYQRALELAYRDAAAQVIPARFRVSS